MNLLCAHIILSKGFVSYANRRIQRSIAGIASGDLGSLCRRRELALMGSGAGMGQVAWTVCCGWIGHNEATRRPCIKVRDDPMRAEQAIHRCQLDALGAHCLRSCIGSCPGGHEGDPHRHGARPARLALCALDRASNTPRNAAVGSRCGASSCAAGSGVSETRRRFPSEQFETPSQSLGFLLWQATNAWQRQIKASLAPFDLTHVQFVLLAGLCWLEQNDDQDSISQKRLAEFCATDPMMTSQVLRTLERAELIERLSHPRDARARRLKLSERGYTKLLVALEAVEATDESFFAMLGSDHAKFLAGLRQLLG
jgi:MarR family transcriptional regulator, organic hydroperoxide resistance regulator